MNATMSLEKIKHYPVMLDQILSIISPQHGGDFIDCTFGGGGYSQAILKHPGTKVTALDRDNLTQVYAKSLLQSYPKRFSFFEKKFSELDKVIKPNQNPRAIIFDLGLSSLQLSDEKRGFSFKSKNSLSMQMGINKYSAYDVVNSLDKKNLSKIIKILGEEKDSKKIANRIIKYRSKKTIKTSEELSLIINEVKKNYNSHKKNTSTKTFQAIRIFVNQELTELILGLILATEILKNEGLLIVVRFHSLEDQIVKSFFNLNSDLNKNPSRYLPLQKNHHGLFKFISKKTITPSKKEIEKNIRSRSGKLRYAVRNSKPFAYPTVFKEKFAKYFDLEEIKL